MAETPMITSDKTREVKRQRNDQDDGPGTKRLSFTRLFVFPIFCGHDPLLCQGVDHDSGRTFDSRLWERSHLAKESGSVLYQFRAPLPTLIGLQRQAEEQSGGRTDKKTGLQLPK